MKTGFAIAALSIMVAADTLSRSVQAQSPSLVGAWRMTDITYQNGRKVPSLPNLHVFTARHYSSLDVTGTRPALKIGERWSEADKIATCDNFEGISGSYEVRGDTVTFSPVVSKDDFMMANGGIVYHQRLKIVGKALTLTQLDGPREGIVMSFVRAE